MSEIIQVLRPHRATAQKVPNPKVELYIQKGFLTPQQCAPLVDLIEQVRRPSTVNDDLGDAYFRTSETCDMDPTLPFVADLDDRICTFLGIDPAFGEPMQGQRYAVGQEFKAHTDYFEPTMDDYAVWCGQAGQRTWTAMLYLNTPEAGGATRFKVIDKTFQPETGKLLCWNNRRPDGSLNYETLHAGMKVRKGVKYVVTKWFRERPWPR